MSITAMRQALDALEYEASRGNDDAYRIQREALRTAIAEAEKQEPVAWLGLEQSDMPDGDDPMYDHDFFIKGMVWADAILRKKNDTPPAAQRQWVGLTEAEINEWDYDTRDVVMDIEKLLREKNT